MENENRDAPDVQKDKPYPYQMDASPQKKEDSEKDSERKDEESSPPKKDNDESEIKKEETLAPVPGTNHVLHVERPEHKLFDTSGQGTNE